MVWHLLYPRDEWEGKGWNPLLFYMRHPSVHMHLVGGDGLGIECLMWFTLLTYQVWVLESHLGQENMENGKLKPPSHIEAICTEWIIDFATKIFRHLVDVEECRNPQEMSDLQLSCHLDINQQGCSHKAGLFLSYLPGTLLISAMANYAVAVHTWVALHQSKKEEEDEVVEALMTDMEVSKLRH